MYPSLINPLKDIKHKCIDGKPYIKVVPDTLQIPPNFNPVVLPSQKLHSFLADLLPTLYLV